MPRVAWPYAKSLQIDRMVGPSVVHTSAMLSDGQPSFGCASSNLTWHFSKRRGRDEGQHQLHRRSFRPGSRE